MLCSAHGREFFHLFPELSNSGCLPGRAGGTPYGSSFETASIVIPRLLLFPLFLLAFQGSAAYSQPVLSTPALAAPPGGQLTVPIDLSEGNGIAEINFTLSYDPSVLSIPEFDQCGQRVARGSLLTGQIVTSSCNFLLKPFFQSVNRNSCTVSGCRGRPPAMSREGMTKSEATGPLGQSGSRNGLPDRCPPEKSRPPCTAMTYANLEMEPKASYPAGHERDSLPGPAHSKDHF